MEISIIIPVYNVSQYLHQCLESICSQYSDGIELILIDDGSTDQSGQICDTYGFLHPYIHVIHQPNQGPSVARNAGIRMASGKYLLFIDSDDYIADGSLPAFLKEIKAHPADLYFLKAEKFYKGGKKAALDSMGSWVTDVGHKTEVLKNLASMSKYPGSGCTKLVKRQMVLDYHIYFEEGVRAEDLAWSLRCILCAQTYHYIGTDYYYYRKARTGSATNVITKRRTYEIYLAIMQGVALAGQEQEPISTYAYAMIAYEVEILLLYYGKLEQTGRASLKQDVRSVCWLLKYRSGMRAKVIRWMVGLFGVDVVGRMLSCMYDLLEILRNGD